MTYSVFGGTLNPTQSFGHTVNGNKTCFVSFYLCLLISGEYRACRRSRFDSSQGSRWEIYEGSCLNAENRLSKWNQRAVRNSNDEVNISYSDDKLCGLLVCNSGGQ